MCREVEKLAMEERLQGREEGQAEGLATAIRALMASQSISLDDAMRYLNIPEADKEKYRKLLEA